MQQAMITTESVHFLIVCSGGEFTNLVLNMIRLLLSCFIILIRPLTFTVIAVDSLLIAPFCVRNRFPRVKFLRTFFGWPLE